MSVKLVPPADPRLLRWTVRCIAGALASATFDSIGRVAFCLRRPRRAELARRQAQRESDKERWLTPHESTLVKSLTEVIIPGSDDSPGASDAGVVGTPVELRIDRLLIKGKSSREIYERGLIAVDEMSRRSHGKDFAELDTPLKHELVTLIESLHRGRATGSARGLWDRILKKLSHVSGMWDGWSAAADLFPVLVSDTKKAFYASEVAWLWLEYDGPPMPLGYESMESPRRGRRSAPLPEAPLLAPRKSSVAKDDADVVVIGSGAGGAVVAKELAEAGLSVIVVEAGRRYFPTTDYLTTTTDFELYAKEAFDPTDARRDAYTTLHAQGFSYSRVKGLGGSTLHYGAMSPRLHPSDFQTRSSDGVGDDWPTSYDELEPYYARVEYELGVSGPDGANPFEPWRSRPYPTKALPLNLAGLVIRRGAERLGFHLVKEPLAIPSSDWNGRPACIGAGTCHIGCLISAKSSMDVTYIRKAEATGRVDIRTESMAREIEVDAGGKARGVVYIDKDGRERRATGKAIVVAGNAVETPRLLFLSASDRFPHGLANSSGLVGRNFIEHLYVSANGLFDDRLDPWRGTPSSGFIQDNYATNPANGFARGWTTIVSPNSHWPATVANRIAGWGDQHKGRMKRTFGHQVCLATIGEQLPDPRNRVVLDPLVKDVYGLPAPCLINEPHDNDRAMISAMSCSLRALLEASGASDIQTGGYRPGDSSHYMGTCRMGNDPERSVVDAWGRTHDVPNLFIADSSVFVTGGAANPALTVSALALRTSERIISMFKRREI